MPENETKIPNLADRLDALHLDLLQLGAELTKQPFANSDQMSALLGSITEARLCMLSARYAASQLREMSDDTSGIINPKHVEIVAGQLATRMGALK